MHQAQAAIKTKVTMPQPAPYQTLQTRLQAEPKVWLITGVAGFIGSNLLEALLKLGQRVGLFVVSHGT